MIGCIYSVVVFGSSLPSSTKKTVSKLDPLWQNFLDQRMQLGNYVFCVCLFVLLLYVPSQQLWSLPDGQFT